MAKSGWRWTSSSWKPRKYQGAFVGLGESPGFAAAPSGARTSAAKSVTPAKTTNVAATSRESSSGRNGTYPRLVLAYLTTEAVRRKSPDIELGSYFSHFCAALGIPPTSGPRGSLPMLREQLERLFASTFQCIFHDESQGRHAGDGFLIAEKRELWWGSPARKGRGSLGLARPALGPLLPRSNRGTGPSRPAGPARPPVAVRDRHLPLADLAVLSAPAAGDDPLAVAGASVRIAVLQSPPLQEALLGLPAERHRLLPGGPCRSGNKGLLLEPSATHVAPRRSPMKL